MAGTMSGGEQQMCAIGRAPDVEIRNCMLLDEPSAGLAPVVVQQVVRAGEAEYAPAGLTVVDRPSRETCSRCCAWSIAPICLEAGSLRASGNVGGR